VTDFPALDLRWEPGPGTTALCDLLYAALDEFEPIAIEVQPGPAGSEPADGWRVFFRSAIERDRAAAELRASFAGRLARVESADVPDEGWARRSQSGLTAIRIGRIVVAPPWDAGAGLGMQIVIDPSTGFGTGHHETTRLCLRILQELDFPVRRVIDVGTGSGVLAIAASMLGAASVAAVDNDPEALRNARENSERNGCTGRVEVLESELSALAIERADIVIANLTAAVLAQHAVELTRLLEPGGTLIVSGFGPAESNAVAAALAPLARQRQQVEGEWVAMVMR
jgi:ribosomal protein L11 methyltransferase